jgi:hypothetical protein
MKCIHVGMVQTDGHTAYFCSYVVEARWTDKARGKWAARDCSPYLATFKQEHTAGRSDWHLVDKWERDEAKAHGLPALRSIFPMYCPDCGTCHLEPPEPNKHQPTEPTP